MQINVHKELEKFDLNQPIKNSLSGQCLSLKEEWTVAEATDYLKSLTDKVELRWFYVVNPKNQLSGVISSHNLLLAKAHETLKSVMDTETITVAAEAPFRVAIRMMNENQLLSLPVIDHDNNFLGIVEMKASPEAATDERHPLKRKKRLYNDIFQLIGVSIERAENKNAFAAFAIRMPWLFSNLFSGFVCLAISKYFEATLQSAIVLAMFIPLVLTLSESVSMQALTLSLGLTHRRIISVGDVFFKLLQEIKTSALLGTASFLIVLLVSLLIINEGIPYLTIGLSIFLSMVFSACLGVVIPVGVKFLKLNPEIAAGPLVLTIADILTTFVYMSLATYFLT
ncbi:magnesium transporter [Estrella lausannensis]|uniref:Putative magnesium transporter n=1 Tax=Estrella lausannensis TaxID=483423 RepID=A0A0H5E2I1_9BACT|nr:magnesium transporter [Estrella lausannensis]CRX37395.1 Putative magnesium transporter [Estrella lausannensis]